jgi:hypothetical protein
MTLGQFSILCGLISVFSFVIFRLKRDKNFGGADLSPLMSVFLAGCNIPAAIFLIYYGFDPQPDKLATYEKFVSMAGLSLLATACITIYSTIVPNKPVTIKTDSADKITAASKGFVNHRKWRVPSNISD